jgi:hypothetical protein
VEQVDTGVVSGFAVTRRDCTTGSAEDAIEFTTAGGTSLRYDTEAGQFIQNWKTPSVPGACYVVTLTTTGGPSLQAAFKTR